MIMKLSIVELGEDETVFYNLGVFIVGEKLLIFPYPEFKEFYEDLIFHLDCLDGVIKEGFVAETMTPERSLELAKYYLDEVKEQVDKLLSYDIQTTLDGYQQALKKPPKRLKYAKEKPQCLLGL